MGKEWDARPTKLPELHVPQMPLAACAILYSYEGICLILPIVSKVGFQPLCCNRPGISLLTIHELLYLALNDRNLL